MTFIPTVLSDVDQNNSSISNLVANTTFTGIVKQTTGYNTIDITINSDQSSAAGGLKVFMSDDGITFLLILTDSYFSNTIYTKSVKILKKYYKIEYTNGSINTTTFSLTSRLNINSEENTSTNNNTIYTNLNDPMNDAFGKLRVSNPFTLIDLQFPGYTGSIDFQNNNLNMCYSTNGNYTTTFSPSLTTLSGTGLGYQINQSRRYLNYQPGKSLLFLASGVIYNSGPTFPTVTSDYQNRIGFFDDKNGLFFEFDSKDGISVVVRDNGSDNKTAQTNWNVDKMDGSGILSQSLDFTKTQLFVLDYEWLGVGRIRFGFYISGLIYYCHQITNINVLTSPYMKSPNLPVRYEIRGNNAGQTIPVSIKQICSTVISEGGFNPIGYPFSITNGSTGIPCNTGETPLLVLVGNSSYNYYHENIVPNNFVIIDSSNGNSVILYRLRLYLSPDSPGTLGTLINVNNNSRSAYTTTVIGFTPSNSVIVEQGYFQGKQATTVGTLNSVFSNYAQITSNINNTSDILVLTCQTISGTATCLATLNFTENY